MHFVLSTFFARERDSPETAHSPTSRSAGLPSHSLVSPSFPIYHVAEFQSHSFIPLTFSPFQWNYCAAR